MPDVTIHSADFSTERKTLTIEAGGLTRQFVFLSAAEMRQWAAEQMNEDRDLGAAVLRGLANDLNLQSAAGWERIYPVTRTSVGALRNLPGRA